MARVDWFVLGFVALMALFGLRKGLIASALSAAGVIGGAIVGARLAPQFLADGSRSPYTPLAGLAGAIVGAVVLQAVVVERLPKTRSGKILRGTMRRIADAEEYSTPATIDDPVILEEIESALARIGYAHAKAAVG